MIVTGITPEQFRAAVEKTSATLYAGNLTVDMGTQHSPTRFRARVIARQSGARTHGKDCAPGARRSWSGRRLTAACWHAYRDVMIEVFNVNPDTRIYTSMAKYRGRDEFERAYPLTANQNIGSMMQPAYMPELCECER